MKTDSQTPLIKPLLRGHFHQAAFFLSIGASSVLLLNSLQVHKFLPTLIYSFCQTALFGISALYHRPTWQPRERLWMKRLDHAAIYISMAGTATPILVLALTPELGTKLLILIWSAALFGIIQSLFWIKAPKWVAALLYVGVGGLFVPYIPELKNALGHTGITLILSGGAAYILGAIVYALKRPNPNPKIFGYHEIFHLLVIVGYVFHFLVIYKLV